MPIVLDASAFIAKLTSSDDFAKKINELTENEIIVAPDLIILETVSGLSKMRIRKEIDTRLFELAYLQISQEDLVLIPSLNLLPNLNNLLGHITAYDASYVAVAISLNATLYTSDNKLAKVARKYCDVICLN